MPHPRARTRWIAGAVILQLLLILALTPAAQGSDFPYGNPAAAVPTPPPRAADGTVRLFGFSGHPLEDPDVFARAIAKAGGKVARIPVQWSLFEPTQDAYADGQGPEMERWQRLHALVSALWSRGMRPVLVIDHAPRWAQIPGECDLGLALYGLPCSLDYLPAPDQLPQLRAFTRDLARKYPFAIFEALNEPNHTMKPSALEFAGRYFAVAKAIYDGARSGGAKRVLIGGLTVSSRTDAHRMSIGEFLDRMYAAGLKQLMPELEMNVHIYPWVADFDADSHWTRSMALVEQALARHQDLGRRLWLTEFGASTSGAQMATEAQQSAIVGGTYAAALSQTRLRIVGLTAYRLRDDDTRPVTDIEQGFGLLRGDMTGKQAWCGLLARRATRVAWPGCP